MPNRTDTPDPATRARYGTIVDGADGYGSAPLTTLDAKPVGLGTRVVRGIRSWVRDAAITLGVCYVAGWFVVTLGTVAFNQLAWQPPKISGYVEKTVRAEVARPFTIAPDPSIAPMAAGMAFESLQPEPRAPGEFKRRVPPARVVVPWQALPPLDQSLFSGLRSSSWWGPNSLGIIASVPKGFSADERRVLRLVGTASVWKTFDLVARAPQVDMVGGRFLTPFSQNAAYWNMPIPRFAATKELAYAGVARAAWHLSEGRRDSAEAALRAVVSFGFAMHDYAVSGIEQLIGAVVIGIGRGGLEEFFVVTKDPRGPALTAALAAAAEAKPPALLEELLGGRERQRSALIRATELSALGPGVRYEALLGLRLSSCGSVRELVVGPNAETRAAFDGARQTLARFPSEAAIVDLIENTLQHDASRIWSTSGDARTRLSAIAGKIYFNPRLGTCALAGFESQVIY